MIAAARELSLDTIGTHTRHIYDKLRANRQLEAASEAFNQKLV